MNHFSRMALCNTLVLASTGYAALLYAEPVSDLATEATAYIQLQRPVVINADLWTDKPQILAANFGFEGIIGVPGLLSAADLPKAVAAGAGVNQDWAELDPVPSLRNLTSATGVAGIAAAGFGAITQFADAMPIEVSWPLLPGTVSPDNIAITLNTGEIVQPVAAALNPNYDHNERHVVVVFGEFANRLSPSTPGAIYPVKVSFIEGKSPMMAIGPDGPVPVTGLSADSSNPYVTGPALVGAKLSHFSPGGDFPPPSLSSAFPNDAYALYGAQAQYRLRLFTSGGFSPDGVSGFLPIDFETFFRLHARTAGGVSIVLDKAGKTYDLGVGTIQVVGLAEVGAPDQDPTDRAYYVEDHDNYFDIVLQGDEAAMKLLESVEIPSSRVRGYSDIYNPGGPGRTPSPSTTYTKPAQAQVFPIDHSLDSLRTVSWASQQLADYDIDIDLPVVFRLMRGKDADVFTSDSQWANQLVSEQHYTVKHTEFANETSRPGVSDVVAYVSEQGDRIYTLDTAEQKALDDDDNWRKEGRVFGAFSQAWPGLAPVYRYYDSKTKRHHFSTDIDANQNSRTVAREGVAWYSVLFVHPAPAPEEENSGGSLGLFGLAAAGLLWWQRRKGHLHTKLK